jgi:hypothetical protein
MNWARVGYEERRWQARQGRGGTARICWNADGRVHSDFKIVVRTNFPERWLQSTLLRTRRPHSAKNLISTAHKSFSFRVMFSHVVIFWTDPNNPNAAEELIAGMEKYLRPIPGALQMHVGKMVTSPRPVVEQSYQVALNLIFANKKAQDDYQVHPLHVEFVNGVFKKTCQRVVVYDFEG